MLLSQIIFYPALFAVLLLLVPNRWVRQTAMIMAVLEFVISLELLKVFDKTSAALQLSETFNWVPQYGIKYSIGIDGISILLVLLTTFLVPVIVLGSWSSITEKIKSFHISLFLLQTAMLGTFLATDMILFYLFWEFSLIPMYLMIGIWGGSRRIYSTVKFFLFTMLGSVLMFVAIMTLVYMTKEQFGSYSAAIFDLYKLQIPFVAGQFISPQNLMFIAFFLAFAIKVPMFPLHTWLPDAHTEAPTPGSVILAGVMLKMGGYGMVRYAIPLFPEAAQYWSTTIMIISAIGIIYGALVSMVQPDIKKLVAYSSVSHMGYVMLGIFALNVYGVGGGMYQMLNHGISTGALFLLIGMIYERTHSREINKYGGLAVVMPIYTIAFLIITMSSIAVPGTNGFIGEFSILMGAFGANQWIGGVSVLGVVLGAAYMLWMVKRVFFGQPGELIKHHAPADINAREITVMTVMIVFVFWMGLFPNHFMSWSKTSVEHFVKNYQSYELSIK